jgi:hypothetical protein
MRQFGYLGRMITETFYPGGNKCPGIRLKVSVVIGISVIIANRCRLGEAVVKGAIRVADVNGKICPAGAP